ncbi:MAG: hypothetical protein J5J06_00035 [Phycisphaerae bacterium]|nr:hypothetical protein [Phycisphaerae bacterium]
MISPWIILVVGAIVLAAGIGVWVALAKRDGRRVHAQKPKFSVGAADSARSNVDEGPRLGSELVEQHSSELPIPLVESRPFGMSDIASPELPKPETGVTTFEDRGRKGEAEHQQEVMDEGSRDTSDDFENAPPSDNLEQQDSTPFSVLTSSVPEPRESSDGLEDAPYGDEQDTIDVQQASGEGGPCQPDEQIDASDHAPSLESVARETGAPTIAADNQPIHHEGGVPDSASGDLTAPETRDPLPPAEPDVAAEIDQECGDSEDFTAPAEAAGESSDDQVTQTTAGTTARGDTEPAPIASPRADQRPESANEEADDKVNSENGGAEAGSIAREEAFPAQVDAGVKAGATDQSAPVVDAGQPPARGSSHNEATQTAVDTKGRDDIELAPSTLPAVSTVPNGASAAEQVEPGTPPETDRTVKQSVEPTGIGNREPSTKPPAARTGPPAKYRPSVRTAETTRRSNREQSSQESNGGTRVRSLPMFVRAVFARSRRNRCRVSLLPSRAAGQDEEVEVIGPSGPENWTACQDEWYSDVFPPKIETLLLKGACWDCAGDKDQRWVLTGRDIWVLAQSPTGTINGFVSVPRLILQENHLVLCRKEQREAVREALSDAGCKVANEVDGGGLPAGWILFQNVQPTNAIHHEDSAGIFNVLRPVHNVEIVFEGGIRLGHANWLNGHPPRIRVRGAVHDVEVLIDQQRASVDGCAGYTAPGWDAPGLHTVFCGGVAESYQLVDGVQQWDQFDAFVYRPSWAETDQRAVVVCGPIVKPVADHQAIALTPASNTCLLGPTPGQIAFWAQPYDVRARECVTIADFPIVWTLPANPLRCDKSQAVVRLLDERCVDGNRGNPAGNCETVLRWCHAILDAGRKGLPIQPNSQEARKLWDQYKRAARRLWKELR